MPTGCYVHKIKQVCKRGHSFADPENIYIDNKGHRKCRACCKLYQHGATVSFVVSDPLKKQLLLEVSKSGKSLSQFLRELCEVAIEAGQEQ